MRRIRGGLSDTAGTSEVAAAQMTKAFKTIGIGAGIAAAGIVGLAVLNRTTVAAEEFGTAIAEVSTLVDEATFSTATMAKITRTLALQFGGKAPVEAKALYQIISAGASNAEEATALLVQTNKLALGGVTDLTTAADGLTTAMNVYAAQGLTAKDASDALFVAMKGGKTTIGELSEAMGRVLPTAGALGISFDEMLAAISAVTLGGLKTREAVTGLKAALAGVQKPTAEAGKEAKRLGIQFDAATLRAKGLNRFMRDIMESSGFTADSFTQLFGSIEGLNAITALATNRGAKFTEMVAAMGRKTGATDAAVEKMSASMEFARKRFEAARADLVLTIGTAIEPFKVAVLDLGRRIFEAFTAIPEPVKRFGVVLLGLASSAAVVVGGIIAIKGAITLLGVIGITALAPFLLLAGKILLVIGLLVAVAFVLKAAWESNFLGVRNVVAGFVEGLKELWGFIVTMLKPAWDEFTAAISTFRNVIVEALTSIGLFGEGTGGTMKGLGKAIFTIATIGIRVAAIFIKTWLWIQTRIIQVVARIIKEFGPLISTVKFVGGIISKVFGLGGDESPVGRVVPTLPELPARTGPTTPGGGGGVTPFPAASALDRLVSERAPETALQPERRGVRETIVQVNIDGDRVVESVDRRREDDRGRRGEMRPVFAR